MTKGVKLGQGGIDLSRNTSIKYLKITGQQIFHYSDDSYKTTPKPETITLKATLYNINLLGNNKIRWYYAAGKDKWIEFPETNSRVATNISEFTIPHDHECWGESTTLTIKAEVECLGKIYNDEFTLAKLAQGSDAYTVLLKDESQVFPTDDRGNYDVNELRALCATELYVYKGITPLKYETQFTVSQTSASSNTLAVDIEGEYHGSSVRIVPKELRADKCSAQLMITIDDKLNPSTEATKTRLTKSMSVTKGKAGRDGESAQIIKITGDNIFKKENNIFTPSKITLTALLQNIDIQSRALGGRWYYSTDRTTWKRCDNYEISESDSFSMINIYPNSPGFTNNLIYYKYEINENLFDLVSVGKISDGLDGIGYSVFLSNDSENIPTDSLGNVSADYLGENGKTFTEVEVYRSEGSVITQLTPTTSSSIGKNEFKLKVLNNQSPQNIAVVSSSQPNKVYLQALSSDSKNFEIQVKLADEQTFTKVFTVVKSKQGFKGDQGLQGLQGPKGDQGIPGTSGDDGRTSYFHIKYSEFENPTLPEHISDTHNKYIGTYVDFNEIDDPNPLRYTWRRFEGAQGEKGEQGLPGLNGENGQTSYLHIKYSNDGGKTFTANNGEDVGDYIGQYTDFEPNDKLDVKLYKWSKIKGEKGEQGLPGLQGIQGPQGIQGIPGADGMNSYFHIKYSPIANPINPSDMTEEPNTYIGTYVDNIEEDSNDPRRYKWSRFEGIQGPQGEQGIPGINGEDGRTSYLHIKYSNDGGRTFTPNNGEDVGAYLGQYTDFIAQDSNDVKRYKWTKIVGETGPQGPQGPQGPAGANGNLEDFPDTLPSKPVLKGKCIGFNSIDLSWTYENKIYYTYEVYASQTSGFTPSSSNVIFEGQGSAFLHNVGPEQTWYYKARAVNTHGRATEYSDQITVRTVKIDDLSNYVNDAAIGNALIGELSFDRAWAGTLKGHYIDAKNLSVTDGNGKKTLDIDSYGNVRLDVNELKISANSVATESFVSNAKNDAISSAATDATNKVNSAKNELNTKIDGIQIGGRNLLRNSQNYSNWLGENGTTVSTIDNSNESTKILQVATNGGADGHVKINVSNYIRGKEYILSFYAKNISGDKTIRFEPHGGPVYSVTSTSEWVQYKVKITPNQDWSSTVPYFYFNNKNNTSVFQIKNVKLEEGNKATDWAPAPEDVDSNISNAKNEAINSANNTLTNTIANYYTREETNSQINVAKNEINLGVSSTYETKANVETKVSTTLNSAKSYADTKKTEAINSAASDATSKVNSAKNELNTKIDNIQVGGRNLWRFTKEYDGTKYSGWVDNNDAYPQAIAPYTTVNGFGVQRIAGTWVDISQRVAIEANTDYTLSAWIKWESTAGSMMFYTNTGTMSGTDVSSQVGTTDYKRVSITFNSGNATVSTCRFECNSNTPYLIYGLKLEKGNKATDWSPAPEDVNSLIDTAAINAINSANQNTATVIANYYTKSETDSKISVAKDEINLGVSNTYETKANVETKINDAIGDVQVGGTNLAIGTNRGGWGWTWAIQTNGGNTKTSEYIDGVDCVKFVKDENDGSGWHFLCYDFFARDKIIPSTEYTLSFEIKSSLDINFYTATLMCSNATESLIKNTRFINSSVKANDENWTKIIAVMTTHDTLPTTTGQVIYLGGLDINANSTYYIRNLQLEKGNRATEWSYAVEDIDNNINDAKQEAITSANNTLTTTIANYYTKEETNSQINIAKNEINLGVSSTYETKANVETKINAIQVGGANLWSETAWVDGAVMGDGTLSDYWTRPHVSYPDFVSVGNNEYITYQCWNPNGIVNDTNYNRIAFYNSDRAVLGSVDVPKLSGEPYQCMTWEIPNGTKYIRFGVISDAGYGGYNTSLKFKFELGNKPTEWSPNALDITNNITTAKNDAITSANNTLNTTIANYYTKSETDSQINIAKDNITSSVSSLRTDIMNTSFTNLLLNSDFQYYQNGVNMPTHYGSTNLQYCYGGGWLCPEGGKTIHINTVGSGGNWHGWTSHFIKASKDQVMTASVYVATDNLNSFNNSLGLEIEWVNSNYERINCSSLYFNIQNSHTWERKSITGTAPEGTAYVRIYCWHHSEGISWWGKPMLQMGSVCTAWDKGGSIDIVEQRLSSAEQKITDTAITNTVKQNFYTKQETENAITSKGYATQSQVQQTAENIEFKFTQSGGYNLIRNGGFENGMAFWSRNLNPEIIENQSWQNYNGKSIFIRATAHGQGIYQHFPTTPGKTYSYSFYAQAEHGPWWAGVENRHTQNIEVSPNNWRRYTGTFTATNNSHAFICYAHDGGRNVFLDNVIVCEGSIPSAYTPHPSEVYDGLTQIDKDGIKVSTSRGAYTRFGAEGMNSYDNDGNMTLGLRNGGMTFHAYNNHEYVGYISQTAQSSNGYNGVSLGLTPLGDYLSFGYAENATDPNKGFSQKSYMSIAPHSNNSNNKEGINLYKNLYMHGWTIDQAQRVISDIFYANGGIQLKGGSGIHFNADATYPSAIWQDASDGALRVYGDNGMYFGYREGTTNAQCLYIKETRDGLGCRIGMYDHLNMNGWRIKNATVNNCSFRLDEYKRTTADYVSIFKASTSSKSEMNIELANDYVTWFNIQANNYADGGRYIACFNYQNGTAANNVGVHFYRAMNCHGYNITNVGNMSVRAMSSEELEVNDIRIASPVSVARMDGRQTPTLSVVKSTDDVTEAHGVVTISNKKEKVELPYGLMFTGYYVQVTGNKVANLAVTEKTDEYFIIETDSEEEIEVFYTIKAFQPNYVTRTSIYGELQGEEGIATMTYEEAMEAQGLSVQEQSLEAAQPRTMSEEEIEGESFIIP